MRSPASGPPRAPVAPSGTASAGPSRAAGFPAIRILFLVTHGPLRELVPVDDDRVVPAPVEPVKDAGQLPALLVGLREHLELGRARVDPGELHASRAAAACASSKRARSSGATSG